MVLKLKDILLSEEIQPQELSNFFTANDRQYFKDKYMKAIFDYIVDNNKKNIINIIHDNNANNIIKVLQNLYSREAKGRTYKCYRGFRFVQPEYVDEMSDFNLASAATPAAKKILSHKKGDTITFTSPGEYLVQHWTSDKATAENFGGKGEKTETYAYVVIESNVPTDWILFAADFEELIYKYLIKDEGTKKFAFSEHEVVVWHKSGLNAKVLETSVT